MKTSYTYIYEQINKIKRALDNTSNTDDEKLTVIEEALIHIHIEKYTGIKQETKQRVINLKKNLKQKHTNNTQNLLLEAAQLVDHVEAAMK